MRVVDTSTLAESASSATGQLPTHLTESYTVAATTSRTLQQPTNFFNVPSEVAPVEEPPAGDDGLVVGILNSPPVAPPPASPPPTVSTPPASPPPTPPPTVQPSFEEEPEETPTASNAEPEAGQSRRKTEAEKEEAKAKKEKEKEAKKEETDKKKKEEPDEDPPATAKPPVATPPTPPAAPTAAAPVPAVTATPVQTTPVVAPVVAPVAAPVVAPPAVVPVAAPVVVAPPVVAPVAAPVVAAPAPVATVVPVVVVAPPVLAPAPAAATVTKPTPSGGNVTVVASADELQRALEAGDQHIQLQSHVDLRGLNGVQQDVEFLSTSEGDGTTRSHLAYITETQSIQGNCKTAPAEANLSTEMQSSIPTDTWVPGQCMLVASEPAFLVMSGNVWFDKLILAVASDVSAPANPNVTLLEVRQTFQGGTGSNMFLTNMLFKGDGASRAIAMSPQHVGSTTGTPVTKFHSLLARDCVFEDFSGSTPPILVSAEGFAYFNNTTFHDIDLESELIDVSYGGAVKMDNVRLTDVKLRNVTGPVVSTSGNDNALCPGALSPSSSALIAPEAAEELYLEYDDDTYDVTAESVATTEVGQGGSLLVSNGTMSDCLRVEWTCALFEKRAPPGCTAQSLQRRSDLEQERCLSSVSLAATVDLNSPPAKGKAGEAVGLGCGDYAEGDSSYDKYYQWGFLDESHPWFSELQQDIPETAETAGERELTTPSVEAQAVDADAVLGGGDDKGIGAGGAAGIAIALALCLLACVIGAVLCIRRKRNREREDEDTWKWYLYRGGDDEGASTRTKDHGGITNETGASSQWLGLSKYGSFFGRSGRSQAPLSGTQVPLSGGGGTPFKVTGPRQNDAGAGKHSLQDAFANMRMMTKQLSGHTGDSTRSYSRLSNTYNTEIVQSPRSGWLQSPRSGWLQSPRSGRQSEIVQSPRSPLQNTPSPSVTPRQSRPTSNTETASQPGSVNYNVAPPLSDPYNARTDRPQRSATSPTQPSSSQAAPSQPGPNSLGSKILPPSGPPTSAAYKVHAAPAGSMNTKASYNAIYDGDGTKESSHMLSGIEVDGIKPVKTSNGMFINPLSARAMANQADSSSRAINQDSSAFDDGNTKSGMITNQQYAGLQSEYRLKSFSTAVSKSPEVGDLVEPKMPEATSATKKDAEARLPQLPEYSTMPKSPEAQMSSFCEQQTQSVSPGNSMALDPAGRSHAGGDGRSKMTAGPSCISNTAALKNQYASEFSGFYGGNTNSAAFAQNNPGSGGGTGGGPRFGGNYGLATTPENIACEKSGFSMTPPGSPGAFMNSTFSKDPMSSYAGFSKDPMSSDGGGGILMQIAADISAPLSGVGDPGLHLPAELAAQFGGVNSPNVADMKFATTPRSHTQQYRTARAISNAAPTPPLSPRGPAPVNSFPSDVSLSPRARAAVSRFPGEVPPSPRGPAAENVFPSDAPSPPDLSRQLSVPCDPCLDGMVPMSQAEQENQESSYQTWVRFGLGGDFEDRFGAAWNRIARMPPVSTNTAPVSAGQNSNALSSSPNLLPPSYDARLIPGGSTRSVPSHDGTGGIYRNQPTASAGATVNASSNQNTYQPPDISADLTYQHDREEEAVTPKRSTEASPMFASQAATGGNLTGKFTQNSNSSFRTAASGMSAPPHNHYLPTVTAAPEPQAWGKTFVPEDDEDEEGSASPDQMSQRERDDAYTGADAAEASVPDASDGMFRSPALSHMTDPGSIRSTLAGCYTDDGAGTPRTFREPTEKEFLTANDVMISSHDSLHPEPTGCSSSAIHAEGSLQAPNTPSRDASGESNNAHAQPQAPKKSGGVVEALSSTPGGALVVGGENKAIPKLSRQLVRQLNRFKTEEQLFLQRFQMMGGEEHRRFGGNSIVQFASTPADKRVWALKFFLSPTAFENESVIYAAHYPELRSQLPIAAAERAAALKRAVQNAGPLRPAGATAKFLPRVELSVGLHGGLMDPKGMPLPPCVVMEKGESLLEWWSHIDQSPHAAQRVLSSVSGCMANMHEAGYVHRDFKPTSIIFQQTSMQFVSVGFSSAERIGGSRPHSFVLGYAAPEIVQFAEEHASEGKALEASTAMDTWSMGVIAIELLTGRPALDVDTDGVERVVAQLKGEELLPWEGNGEDAIVLREQLGTFRGPILSLLHRDPSARESLRHFQSLCSRGVATARH